MKLYNSKTQSIEPFVPRSKRSVFLYVCGITPYDTTHLGHAFTYVFFDALIAYLRFKKYNITYVQNVTDIDNDILKRAKQEGRDWKELGQYWTDKFLSDLRNLSVAMPTHYVKATDSIPMIITIIASLIGKKCAYENDGNVYFSVDSFPLYGELSHFTPKQMLLISQERGADPTDTKKKNPLDFILWQKSLIGEPFWESPWGKGRPGWHIECSAMIKQYLGDQIDIHGGGRDLIYPHHSSEIAQSESSTGRVPFVKYWMHTAMLMYQGEKMSKSLGNLIMVSDLLKTYSPQVIRYELLSHHYRKPWEFDEEQLKIASDNIKRLTSFAKFAITEEIDTNSYFDTCVSYLEDDFQSEMVFPYLVSLLNEKTIMTNASEKQKAAIAMRKILTIFGLEK